MTIISHNDIIQEILFKKNSAGEEFTLVVNLAYALIYQTRQTYVILKRKKWGCDMEILMDLKSGNTYFLINTLISCFKARTI